MWGKRKGLVTVVGAGLLAMMVFGTAIAQTDSSDGKTGSDYRQAFLDRVASRLGIERSRLDTAFTQAGGDMLDQAVRDGDLTQKQADQLREKLEQNGGMPFWGPGHRGGFGHHGPFGGCLKVKDGAGLEAAAAAALGITTDELTAELREGKSLGEIADARGVDRQKVTDALVAAHKAKLDEAVANGDLTQKQADQMLERFQSMDLLEKPMGHHGPWKKGRGWGGWGTPSAMSGGLRM